MESKNYDQEKMLIKFLSRKFQKKENSQRTKKNDQNCKARIREENYEKFKRLMNLQSHSNSSIDEILDNRKQGQLQKHTKNCRLRKDDENKRAVQEQKEKEDLNGLVNGAYGAHDTETQRHVCYFIDKLQQQNSQKFAVHFKINQVHRSDEEFRKFILEQKAIEDVYYRQKSANATKPLVTYRRMKTENFPFSLEQMERFLQITITKILNQFLRKQGLVIVGLMKIRQSN